MTNFLNSLFGSFNGSKETSSVDTTRDDDNDGSTCELPTDEIDLRNIEDACSVI
jgi:hypothetical protein